MEKNIIIDNDSGLHARPASELVELTKNMDSDIKIIKDGKEADAKSIFNIMALAIPSGAEITVKVNGGNEEDNLNKLVDFFENLED